MFDLLKKIINNRPAAAERGIPTVDKTRLAAGVLLLETAHIDEECT